MKYYELYLSYQTSTNGLKHKVLQRVHFLHLDIFSKVTLRADKDERSEGGMSADLWNPLLWNILEGGRTDDTEAQQEHVGAGVAQRSQLVKLILERRTKVFRSSGMKPL